MSEQQLTQQDAPAAGVNDVQPEPEGKESTPSLETLLRQAELNAQEHHDAWLRARAEAENARRRAADEIDKARRFALDKFAGDLLVVKDSLEAALSTGDGATLESIRGGVELTLKQLSGVFERHAIRELAPLGEKFDPNSHQAIAMVDAEGEANTVASVLQKGYLLNERVIRPALVTVVKPKA